MAWYCSFTINVDILHINYQFLISVNPEISDIFNDYAQFCFKEFGDRVEIWLTINEPHEEALDAYGLGVFAPGIKDMASGPYQGK